MSYGRQELYDLLNVTSVTSLLTKSNYIFGGRVIPDRDANGDKIPAQAETVNFYRVGVVDNGIEYLQTNWSINCRSANEAKADALALAVKEAVNRKSSDNVFFVASTLAVLPPADTTDNFNVPVEVVAKGREV